MRKAQLRKDNPENLATQTKKRKKKKKKKKEKSSNVKLLLTFTFHKKMYLLSKLRYSLFRHR
jgi:hypothetical protein